MALALTIGPADAARSAWCSTRWCGSTGFSFAELVRVSYPYVDAARRLTAVLILFPDLTLFLPRLLGYADAN